MQMRAAVLLLRVAFALAFLALALSFVSTHHPAVAVVLAAVSLLALVPVHARWLTEPSARRGRLTWLDLPGWYAVAMVGWVVLGGLALVVLHLAQR